VKKISLDTEQRLLKGTKSTTGLQDISSSKNLLDDDGLCSLQELDNSNWEASSDTKQLEGEGSVGERCKHLQ
jgi:hypothetical protein